MLSDGADDAETVRAVGSSNTGLAETTTTSQVEEVGLADLVTEAPEGFRTAQVVAIVAAACEAMAGDAAHTAGVTPLHRGDPGYASHLDGDDDGVACER